MSETCPKCGEPSTSLGSFECESYTTCGGKLVQSEDCHQRQKEQLEHQIAVANASMIDDIRSLERAGIDVPDEFGPSMNLAGAIGLACGELDSLRQQLAAMMEQSVLWKRAHGVCAEQLGRALLNLFAANERAEKAEQRLTSSPSWHPRPTCPGWWIGATELVKDVPRSLSGRLWHIANVDLDWGETAPLWYGPVPVPPEVNDVRN